MGNPTGRLVLNHSTHIPGLIVVLERLGQQDGIQTITPGVIGSVRSHAPCLILKISTPTLGGFKVLARLGKTVQEVFIVTRLSQEDLKQAIAIALRKK